MTTPTSIDMFMDFMEEMYTAGDQVLMKRIPIMTPKQMTALETKLNIEHADISERLVKSQAADKVRHDDIVNRLQKVQSDKDMRKGYASLNREFEAAKQSQSVRFVRRHYEQFSSVFCNKTMDAISQYHSTRCHSTVWLINMLNDTNAAIERIKQRMNRHQRDSEASTEEESEGEYEMKMEKERKTHQQTIVYVAEDEDW